MIQFLLFFAVEEATFTELPFGIYKPHSPSNPSKNHRHTLVFLIKEVHLPILFLRTTPVKINISSVFTPCLSLFII